MAKSKLRLEQHTRPERVSLCKLPNKLHLLTWDAFENQHERVLTKAMALNAVNDTHTPKAIRSVLMGGFKSGEIT